MGVIRYDVIMISVLIQCHNQEVELARTLSALVPGAVEGLVSDVVIFDNDSNDGTAKVADAAGCRLYNPSHLSQISAKLRGDWILMIEPGAKPLHGWVEGLTEHISVSQKSAKLSPAINYQLPFVKRILTKNTPLEYGALLLKSEFKKRLSGSESLDDIASGLKTVTLKCEMVSAAYTKRIV